MKKIMVLILTVSMVFMFTAIVLADNSGRVYIDYMPNGTLENDFKISFAGDSNSFKENFDTTPINIGFDYLFNQFKVGAEYTLGSVDDTGSKGDKMDGDMTNLKLNFGYRLIDNDVFKLDIVGSYDSFTFTFKENDVDSKSKAKATGIALGCDAIYQMENSYFECSVGYMPDADFEANGMSLDDAGLDDANILSYKIKYTYLLGSNWGVSVGYSSFNTTGNFSQEIAGEKYKETLKMNTNGFTLGATYHF